MPDDAEGNRRLSGPLEQKQYETPVLVLSRLREEGRSIVAEGPRPRGGDVMKRYTTANAPANKRTRKSKYQREHTPLHRSEVGCAYRGPLDDHDACPECGAVRVSWTDVAGAHVPNDKGRYGYVLTYRDGSTWKIQGRP